MEPSKEERIKPRIISLIAVLNNNNDDKACVDAITFICQCEQYIETSSFSRIVIALLGEFVDNVSKTERKTVSSSSGTLLLGTLRMMRLWLGLSGAIACFSRHRLEQVKRLLFELTCGPGSSVSNHLSMGRSSVSSQVSDEANAVKLALIAFYCRRRASLLKKKKPRDTASASASSNKRSSLRCERDSILSIRRDSVIDAAPSDGTNTPKKLLLHTPATIAEYITVHDSELFAAIPLRDFAFANKPKPNSLLKRFAARGDRQSYWVASHILAQQTIPAQAHAFCMFVMVAHWCRRQGNYNACANIMAGFATHAVNRLFRVWDKNIGRNYRQIYVDLQATVSMYDNWAKLRALQNAQTQGVSIPFVAAILKDVALVEEANPSWLPNGDPNYEKMRLLAKLLSDVHARQKTASLVSKNVNRDSVLWTHVSTLPANNTDYLDKRSFEIRPKTDIQTYSTDESLSSTDVSFGSNAGDQSDSSVSIHIDENMLVDLSQHSSRSYGSEHD